MGTSKIDYCLWPCYLAITSTGQGLWLGLHKGSTNSGSDFKASQKTGPGLKSHQTDWEKPGIEPATPGLEGIMLIYPLHHGSFSLQRLTLKGKVK